jgi:hypothetical protein
MVCCQAGRAFQSVRPACLFLPCPPRGQLQENA